MSFVSVTFFIFAIVSIVILRLPSRLILREARVFILNLWFISTYFRSPHDFMPLLAFMAFGYIGIFSVSKSHKNLILSLFIAAILTAFIWMKRYAVLVILEHHFNMTFAPIQTVGLSYILFRIIHLMIDVAQSDQPPPSLLRYLNYCLFFPNFVSGPIQRYSDFSEQMARPLLPLDTETVTYAVTRICRGILMIAFASAFANNVGDWAQTHYYAASLPSADRWIAVAYLSAASILYLINVYTNFAGYMDMVIGVGKLCGFDIPENFNRPFLAKNFLDLWARWHITLSEWFKFYLFNPILKSMVMKWDNPRWSIYFGSVAFFITFLVMGFWHGTTFSFIVYGVFLGFGAMLTKTWQVVLTQRLGKKSYKALAQRSWYFQMSRALTLSYFAVALICLWFEPSRLVGIGRWRFTGQIAITFWVLTAAIMLVSTAIDFVIAMVVPQRLDTTPVAPTNGPVWTPLRLAFWVFLAINVLAVAGGNAPEFIYKTF